jgi:hypothetical protein
MPKASGSMSGMAISVADVPPDRSDSAGRGPPVKPADPTKGVEDYLAHDGMIFLRWRASPSRLPLAAPSWGAAGEGFSAAAAIEHRGTDRHRFPNRS